jgi:hypothetical protein
MADRGKKRGEHVNTPCRWLGGASNQLVREGEGGFGWEVGDRLSLGGCMSNTYIKDENEPRGHRHTCGLPVRRMVKCTSYEGSVNMIPKVKLEHLDLSRMLCGTNQFVGISHVYGAFYRVRDPGLIHRSPLSTFYYMHKFKAVKKIVEIMLFLAQEHGVNACISSPRDSIHEAIQQVRKETGEHYHWICTPSTRLTAKGLPPDIWGQIQWCADHGVSVCAPHRDYTDKALDKAAFTIKGYPEISARIRDLKMIPGLSTHYVETIKAVEDNKYDAPVIVQPHNKIGFESDTDPAMLTRCIQETKLQVINIKPMAAGRLRPREGLEWCLHRIKPVDFLAVGFGDIKFAREDVEVVEQIMNASR